MRMRRMITLASAILLLLSVAVPAFAATPAPSSRSRMLPGQPIYETQRAPVDRYPDLQGVTLTVPVGTPLPKGDKLWEMLARAEAARLQAVEGQGEVAVTESCATCQPTPPQG